MRVNHTAAEHSVPELHRDNALDAGDAQRSCAWAGRHLHPICLANRACGAVQVCSPEAHSPDLRHASRKHFLRVSLFLLGWGSPVRPSAMLRERKSLARWSNTRTYRFSAPDAGRKSTIGIARLVRFS